MFPTSVRQCLGSVQHSPGKERNDDLSRIGYPLSPGCLALWYCRLVVLRVDLLASRRLTPSPFRDFTRVLKYVCVDMRMREAQDIQGHTRSGRDVSQR